MVCVRGVVCWCVVGWMVLLILVYNMMGASQVLPIYMFVKILYSAFLFLHGWNEFLTYLTRGDYSFLKCFQDLFRLNVMAVLLCLSMNRPYQFYEFVSPTSRPNSSPTHSHLLYIYVCVHMSNVIPDPLDFLLDHCGVHRTESSAQNHVGSL